MKLCRILFAIVAFPAEFSASALHLGSQIPIGDFVVVPAAGNQAFPLYGSALATNGKDFLIFWADRRNVVNSDASYNDLYAARVTADGRVIDASGILVARRVSYATAASNGRDYLLAWADRGSIYGARISAATG